MDTNILQQFAFAFAGGMILNIMPCVLPVLTMKVFHLIEHAKDDPIMHKKHGIAYAAGIVTTFVIFAFLILGLKAAGDQYNWGMQFTEPRFVAVLTAMVFVFGLNALGVFEFSLSVQSEEKGGLFGSFVNGVVASIMSTPCSAPMLGSAAGFALGASAPWWVTFSIFVLIGFGLAAPFVLVSFVPAIGRMLPKPGAWMETFKHLMGFTLIGAALWLFSVLQKQLAVESATGFLMFLFCVSVGLWALDRFGGPIHTNLRRYGVRVVAVGFMVLAGMAFVSFEPPTDSSVVQSPTGPVVVDDRINWVDFSPDVIGQMRSANRPVFVDYTADWCANCKTNERLFIEVQTIRDLFEETQIMPMKADLTNDDDVIQQWLEPFPYAGIPVYVIYMPDGSYDLLPQSITTELLAGRLRAASAQYPASSFDYSALE